MTVKQKMRAQSTALLTISAMITAAARSSGTLDDFAKRCDLHPRTLWQRRKHPEKLTLGELFTITNAMSDSVVQIDPAVILAAVGLFPDGEK